MMFLSLKLKWSGENQLKRLPFRQTKPIFEIPMLIFPGFHGTFIARVNHSRALQRTRYQRDQKPPQ
jgi:hypothetical protein